MVVASRHDSPCLAELLKDRLAVVLPGFVEPSEADALARTIEAHPEDHLGDPAGTVATLGAAWFAHAGHDERGYFDRVAAANAAVERVAPWLGFRVLDWCTSLVCDSVKRRGWAGPGFVIIRTSRTDGAGDVHFDWEGLAADDKADLATDSYSFVCMIQKPEEGSGLRIWDLAWSDPSTGKAGNATATGEVASAEIDYSVGDLVGFDGHDLHQIQPCRGRTDRICLTFHLARLAQGWRVWL